MPNWVANRVELATTGSYDRFVDRFVRDGQVDFDTVRPMPEGLGDMPGTFGDEALWAMAYAIDGWRARHGGRRMSDGLDEDGARSAVLHAVYDMFPGKVACPLSDREVDVIARRVLDPAAMAADAAAYATDPSGRWPATYGDWGERALGYRVTCGHADWYGWSCANWGTKWNASSTALDPSGLSVTFDTAWSCVTDVVSDMVSSLGATAYYSFADEDFAENCGEVLFVGGEAVDGGTYRSDPTGPARLAFDVASWLRDPGQDLWRFDEDASAVTYVGDRESGAACLPRVDVMTPMRSRFLGMRLGG